MPSWDEYIDARKKFEATLATKDLDELFIEKVFFDLAIHRNSQEIMQVIARTLMTIVPGSPPPVLH